MFDSSISESAADRKNRGMSLAAGLLIASSCFALLFVAMAHLIPLVLCFIHSPQSKWLPAVSLSLVTISGLIACLRLRAKKARANGRAKSAH